MSVSAKHIHVPILVDDGAMAISGSRHLSLHRSEPALVVHALVQHRSVQPRLLPLLHRVVVRVKTGVSVLNNKGVDHLQTGRRSEDLLLLMLPVLFNCALVTGCLIRFPVRRLVGLPTGRGASLAPSGRTGASVLLLVGRGERGLLHGKVGRGLLFLPLLLLGVLRDALGRAVEHVHVVQLLRYLQDASENVDSPIRH